MPHSRSFNLRVAVFAALCACDSGPIDSGLPEDKPASQLTAREATQLCAAAHEYYERVVSDEELVGYICTSLALAASGGDLAVCEEEAEQCVAAPSPAVEAIAADVRAHGICEPLILASCEATVGEVEDCLAEFVAHIDRLYASHSCAMLTEPGEETIVLSVGPACEAIAERCPKIAS